MIDFKSRIVEALSQEIENLDKQEIERAIEIPPDYTMGDYAFPTFPLAKIYRKNPNAIATDLAEKLGDMEEFERIEVKGAYLNFFVNRLRLAQEVLGEIYEKEDDYGRVNVGQDRPVVVEYSSPNIAKPFHIGHIRTTVIGDAIERIYKFLGYKTIAVNHLGDYGTQFGMMIEAYKRWGEPEVIEKNPIPELVKLYVRINQEAKEEPELLDRSRDWFRRLENKDPEAVHLWEYFRELSLKEFERVYGILDISFDSYKGESFYSDLMPQVVQEMKEKEVLEEDQGALIVNLEDYNLPPAIIIKRDGSTIYITRDITTAMYRKKTYDFYKNIYVVGSQQNLHFKQLFAILDKMGHKWAEDCVHVPFGMVSLEEGTLSTRQGKVIYLEDVLDKATQEVDKILEKREEDQGRKLDNRQELAHQIGVGAVKFQELFNQRIKDYVFNWEQTLSFDGETGPYVQYSHARVSSLLNKGGFSKEDPIKTDLLGEKEEIDLLRSLYGFSQTVIDAHEKYEPYFITRYIVELAKNFNKYYNATQILVEDQDLRRARLGLCYGVKVVLKTGLSLLGIKAPEAM
ncbi:MAG: arginine--tRNA ligase [Tissierellia bacterium]|nr:arginine--tRNA ligase [Tissierellia bacterium]